MSHLTSKKLINSAFYAIFMTYLAYLLVYSSNDYAIINNIDVIINTLWIIVGALAGFILFYSIWLKKKESISTKKATQNSIFAILLFVLYKGFAFMIAVVDFSLNGWG